LAEVYCIVNKTIKLADRTQKINLNEPLAYDNANAHAMRVTVFNDDGGPESLSGVGVVGNFMKSDGNTVTPINGTVNGNVAEVILPASCYVTPGRYKFTMNLAKTEAEPTDGIEAFSTSKAYAKGDKVVYNSKVYVFTSAHSAGAWSGIDAEESILNYSRTVLWVEGHVEKNINGTIIDPGTPVTNIDQIISQANATAASATQAATRANAAADRAEQYGDFIEEDTDGIVFIT